MKKLIVFSIIFLLISSISYSQKKEKKESTRKMNTDFIHWYGQSAIRIEDGGKQIFIDPFKLPSSIEVKADYIFITHGHMDHYSPDDIEKIKKENTVIIAPSDIAEKIKGEVISVKPDTSFNLDKMKISTIPAYNLNKSFHPKSNNWVGYIIHLSNGLNIYHSGDTDAIPEMKNIKVDIALLPIGGKYTMTAEEAADIVNVFQPKLAIPMHYGSIVGSQKDAENFKKLCKVPVAIKMQEK